MIQIEMDMPKSCKHCRFRKYEDVFYNKVKIVCGIIEGMKGDENKRPEFCPLKECE